MLLHMCALCRQYLVDQQVESASAHLETEVQDPGVEVLAKLIELDTTLVKLENKITQQLTTVFGVKNYHCFTPASSV